MFVYHTLASGYNFNTNRLTRNDFSRFIVSSRTKKENLLNSRVFVFYKAIDAFLPLSLSRQFRIEVFYAYEIREQYSYLHYLSNSYQWRRYERKSSFSTLRFNRIQMVSEKVTSEVRKNKHKILDIRKMQPVARK